VRSVSNTQFTTLAETLRNVPSSCAANKPRNNGCMFLRHVLIYPVFITTGKDLGKVMCVGIIPTKIKEHRQPRKFADWRHRVEHCLLRNPTLVPPFLASPQFPLHRCIKAWWVMFFIMQHTGPQQRFCARNCTFASAQW